MSASAFEWLDEDDLRRDGPETNANIDVFRDEGILYAVDLDEDSEHRDPDRWMTLRWEDA